jgi:transcriptional regulator with XRE-family HTH domain
VSISPVQRARLDKRMSVEQLASLAKLNVRTVRRVEDHRSVREETIYALADVLDIRAGDIASDIAAHREEQTA